jgi:hypothetical protein
MAWTESRASSNELQRYIRDLVALSTHRLRHLSNVNNQAIQNTGTWLQIHSGNW